jgi:hypothetical protein
MSGRGTAQPTSGGACAISFTNGGTAFAQCGHL